MNRNQRAPVLAIAIESAEARLVEQMIEQGELPTLRSLLAAGRWLRLESPAYIGTTTVWPSFMTGEEVAEHGIYSEYCWEPATMSLSAFTGRDLKPFWKELSHNGTSVGIVAVPFMPFVRVTNGFEISEAEPYVLNGDGQHAISKQMAREALSHGHISVSGPEDFNHLQELAAGSLEGIRLRGRLAAALLAEKQPDLSVIVFSETHESAHCLWQTVEPEHPLFKEEFFRRLLEIRPTVKEIYQEVDRQIAKLREVAGRDATVLVFALHGMKPARGVPTFLAPLMCEAGFCSVANLKNQSWKGRSIQLLAAAKRRTPAALKKIYYRTMPAATVKGAALPTLMPRYDWSRTRAFSLVTEQHGSIRVNLIGREAEGIVPVAEYGSVCGEVAAWLSTLQAEDGTPLAKKIIQTADNGKQALRRRIPDVLVHWEDDAFLSPLRIKGSDVDFYSDGRRYLSQHTSEGFCILSGGTEVEVDDVLPVKDLGRLITRILTGWSRLEGAASDREPAAL